jgi:hypothetical protein
MRSPTQPTFATQEQLKDRPRPGANQTGAGSPTTQQAVQEDTSMTDGHRGAGEWVPRLGQLEGLPAGRAALIRGLFELAAWVADHPGLPLPHVQARMVPGHGVCADECAVVDEVAAELGVTAGLRANREHYVAEARFGPVVVTCAARAGEHLAGCHAPDAQLTDCADVQPTGALAGGLRAGGPR